MNVIKKSISKIKKIKEESPVRIKQTKITIIDNKVIKIENYSSLDNITETEISTNGCSIYGDNLVITYMSKKILNVKGLVKEINFPYKH